MKDNIIPEQEHMSWQGVSYSASKCEMVFDFTGLLANSVNGLSSKYYQEHVSCQRQQGASNYVERDVHLRTFSAFCVGAMGNTRCDSIVVIAIANTHTPDDTTDSLSLRSFYGKNYLLL